MRFLCLLLITTTALSGCTGTSLDKPSKNATLTGREEVKLKLAHATEESGDAAGAERIYLQVVLMTPNAASPHVELAEFYRRHHEDDKAVASFNAALAIEPNNTEIIRDLANSYIGTGEPEKAIPLLNKAIALTPRNPLLYNSKGVALDQTGRYDEAQECYKTAYDLDPVGGTTYKINISMSYILAGSYDKAIDLLRPMLTAPESPPIVRQNLALAYGMKGESAEALKLGLQDLSDSEAQENVRFYRMLAQKHNRALSLKAGDAPPAAIIKDLFPVQESLPESVAITPEPKYLANPTPVEPVIVHDVEAAPSSPKAPYVKAEEPEKAAATDDASLPVPVLKPYIH